MKKLFFGLCLLGLVTGGLRADTGWEDFDPGLARSLKEGKPLMVDLYTTWCHWCEVMDEKTFNNRKVKAYLDKHFVKVRILAEDQDATLTYQGKRYSHVEFSRAVGVRGYPSIAFFDRDGELITVIPGYIPPETFLPMLKYITQECYKKKISFKDFLKKQRECDG